VLHLPIPSASVDSTADVNIICQRHVKKSIKVSDRETIDHVERKQNDAPVGNRLVHNKPKDIVHFTIVKNLFCQFTWL
jgi:hypothetical protein